MRRRVPILAAEAFSAAADEMIFNEVVHWIKNDREATEALSRSLREMGQTRFVNMTSGMMDSRVSLVLYAGNGNVVKIMPESHVSQEFLFQMPAISETQVRTEDRKYLIRTYPWLSSRQTTTKEDVETLRRHTAILGQEFNAGDDTPRNIMRLPDAEGTLVSIDADTFTTSREGLMYGPEMVQAWKDYVAELFPVYKSGELPRQNADTSFEYVMRYNREARLSRFDPLAPSPAVYIPADGAHTPQRRSFWDLFPKIQHD